MLKNVCLFQKRLFNCRDRDSFHICHKQPHWDLELLWHVPSGTVAIVIIFSCWAERWCWDQYNLFPQVPILMVLSGVHDSVEITIYFCIFHTAWLLLWSHASSVIYLFNHQLFLLNAISVTRVTVNRVSTISKYYMPHYYNIRVLFYLFQQKTFPSSEILFTIWLLFPIEGNR